MHKLAHSVLKQFNRFAAAVIWTAYLPVRFVAYMADIGAYFTALFFHIVEFFYCLFARAFLVYLVVIILVCVMPPLIFPALILAAFMAPRAIKETWEMTG